MAVEWHSPQVVERVRRGALRGVTVGIGIVEARAIALILQTKKSGRIYRRRGKAHQASAPGEPFASDTGQTLAARTIKIDAARLLARLIFHSWNAVRMEHGTRNMRARPYARRALAETRDQVQDAVFDEILRELRRPDGKP